MPRVDYKYELAFTRVSLKPKIMSMESLEVLKAQL